MTTSLTTNTSMRSIRLRGSLKIKESSDVGLSFFVFMVVIVVVLLPGDDVVVDFDYVGRVDVSIVVGVHLGGNVIVVRV